MPEGQGGDDGCRRRSTTRTAIDSTRACRVKAIRARRRLALTEKDLDQLLPTAVYKPEICIRTTLESARAHAFRWTGSSSRSPRARRVEDGRWLATILREYQRYGFLTAIDDFGAGVRRFEPAGRFPARHRQAGHGVIRDVDTSAPRQAIVRGMLRICQDLGITVIAEGNRDGRWSAISWPARACG